MTPEKPVDDMSASHLMRTASAETGLSDFGDEWFTPHLQALLHALSDEANLSVQGYDNMRNRLVGLLATRLRFQRQVGLNPEILDETVVAPMVLIGLPTPVHIRSDFIK